MFLAVIVDLFSRFAVGVVCRMSAPRELLLQRSDGELFSTFKSELGERFESYAEAKEKASDYIEAIYNQSRIHSSIGYVSPAELERRHRDQVTVGATA